MFTSAQEHGLVHHAHMSPCSRDFDSLVERKSYTEWCLVTIPLTQEMGEGVPGSEVQVAYRGGGSDGYGGGGGGAPGLC